MSGSRRGGQSASTGEDAKYMSEEAVGWDECFPTVGPWDASATAWRRRLRDHGDLWGRPWRVEMAGVDMLALSFASTQFHFARSLHLDGGTLIARYSVTNLDREPLPYALLAVEPDDTIELAGVDKVRASSPVARRQEAPSGRAQLVGPQRHACPSPSIKCSRLGRSSQASFLSMALPAVSLASATPGSGSKSAGINR